MIEILTNNTTLFILIISFIGIVGMTFRIVKMKNQNDLHKYFIIFNITLMIHVIPLILQIMFKNTSIKPIYFDYFTYLGGALSPILILFISLAYSDNKSIIKKINKYIFILPIIFLICLWTNDLHGLFYKTYSIYLSQTEYGPILICYAIYSYGLFLISLIILIKATIRKSGFFSIQSLLIIIGVLVPIFGNFVGLLRLINSTIYITPILFIVTSITCSLAIFKYKALNITPIAFRTVIDTMSDAFIVISDDGTIVDSNQTFKKTFKNISMTNSFNLFEEIEKNKLINVKELKEDINKTRKNGIIITKEYKFNINKTNKFFEVDIHPIKTKQKVTEYVGTLFLFKDITQHKEDIKALEEKQDIIVKQGQLVSIGELAGGVAHDINTPIAAIKTGIVMLNTMTSERTDNEKEILFRMDNCATKIINIVNSMRNQIRNLGGDTIIKFKISGVINDIKIITYHEVGKNKSEIVIDIKDDIEIKGDPTKFGQVITNLVVNAAQAYGDIGGKINVTVEKAPNNMAMVKVTDFAGGLDESIAPFVFKNILTTKGTGGTGLGLYLAYSVVVGVFKGNITFESEKGKGTTFYISIPRA